MFEKLERKVSLLARICSPSQNYMEIGSRNKWTRINQTLFKASWIMTRGQKLNIQPLNAKAFTWNLQRRREGHVKNSAQNNPRRKRSDVALVSVLIQLLHITHHIYCDLNYFCDHMCDDIIFPWQPQPSMQVSWRKIKQQRRNQAAV